MKFLFTVALTVLLSSTIYAQKQIEYFFSKAVHDTLDKEILKRGYKTPFIIISNVRDENDIFTLHIDEYDSTRKLKHWTETLSGLTNRYVKLASGEIPIIFEFDFFLGVAAWPEDIDRPVRSVRIYERNGIKIKGSGELIRDN